MTTLHEIRVTDEIVDRIVSLPMSIGCVDHPETNVGDYVYATGPTRWVLVRYSGRPEIDEYIQVRAFGTTPAPSSIEEALVQVAE